MQDISDNPLRVGDEDYGKSTPRYEIDEDRAYEDHAPKSWRKIDARLPKY